MNWYPFDQNNSGGFFVVNESVCHRVWIEAETMQAAIDKATSLGIYFNGVEAGEDCECCGDRWCTPWDALVIPEGVAGIEAYAELMANKWGWTSPDVRLYYADGQVKEVYSTRITRKEG